MLKILQARIQQYVDHELPDVQAGFWKGRGTRDEISNICWMIEKARENQKNIYFCFIDYAKALTGWSSQSYGFSSSHVWMWELDYKESGVLKNWFFWILLFKTNKQKIIFLTIWTFVDKVMSLLFNMLSRLVITFFLRSKCLLISWLQSPSAVILEPPKIKSDTVSTVYPSICHEKVGPDAMILLFWMLGFKPTFSLSTFTFIKRLFSSSSLSAMRVVSSAYLRLLIFLPAILIPACASSSPVFLMMYSA